MLEPHCQFRLQLGKHQGFPVTHSVTRAFFPSAAFPKTKITSFKSHLHGVLLPEPGQVLGHDILGDYCVSNLLFGVSSVLLFPGLPYLWPDRCAFPPPVRLLRGQTRPQVLHRAGTQLRTCGVSLGSNRPALYPVTQHFWAEILQKLAANLHRVPCVLCLFSLPWRV